MNPGTHVTACRAEIRRRRKHREPPANPVAQLKLAAREKRTNDIMSLPTKYQSWSDVAVFEDANAGRAVEIFLTGKGIPARTYDDKLFRCFLFLHPPRLTVRVQVRQNHVKAAADYLGAGAPDALQKAIHCPFCGSRRVSYPQMTRKFILPTIILHLGIIFRVIDHECYCEHCHYLWNLPAEKVRAAPKPAGQFPFSAAR